MASIADLAGVGVATLYRRYPTREDLLSALTERSFTLVRDLAHSIAARDEPGIVSLERFLEGTIDHRDQLVLPMHGGPATLSAEAVRLRDEVHTALAEILDRGGVTGRSGRA